MMFGNPWFIGAVVCRYHLSKFYKELGYIVGKDGLSCVSQVFFSLKRATSFKNGKGRLRAISGLPDAAAEAKSADLVCPTGRRASGDMDLGQDAVSEIFLADSLQTGG